MDACRREVAKPTARKELLLQFVGRMIAIHEREDKLVKECPKITDPKSAEARDLQERKLILFLQFSPWIEEIRAEAIREGCKWEARAAFSEWIDIREIGEAALRW